MKMLERVQDEEEKCKKGSRDWHDLASLYITYVIFEIPLASFLFSEKVIDENHMA